MRKLWCSAWSFVGGYFPSLWNSENNDFTTRRRMTPGTFHPPTSDEFYWWDLWGGREFSLHGTTAAIINVAVSPKKHIDIANLQVVSIYHHTPEAVFYVHHQMVKASEKKRERARFSASRKKSLELNCWQWCPTDQLCCIYFARVYACSPKIKQTK